MANTRLQRTFSQAATSTKKGTFSFWMKRASISGEQDILASPYGSGRSFIRFESSGQMYGTINNASDSYITNMKFRDTSAWYHIVLAIDLTQSTSTDRLKFYVNGDLVTSYSSQSAPSSSETISWGQNGKITDIGYDTTDGGAGYFNGSLSHIHWIDGTAYDASAFGETDSTTGEWEIKTSPSVTYGTNGFFILKDGNTITDSSPNSNNFTVAGGTLTKTEDCPSNVFATWNPLQATTSASYAFEAGNTRMSVNDAAVFSLGATLAATTGKYYMEMKWVQQGGNGSWGMIPIDTDINNRPRNAGVGWNQGDNAPWLLGSIVSGSWGGSIGTSDIIQLAMDLDNGAFYFGKNGTYLNSGNPTSGSSRTGAVNFSGTSLFGEQLTFAIGKGASGTDGWNANFGNGYIEQTPVSSAGTNASGNGIFEYDVPSGYTALSTKGLNL